MDSQEPHKPGPLPHPPARPLVAVMSSGFFGFFAHAGFLQGLADTGLEPDAYAGTSSGALVAALAAAGMEPREMLDLFRRLRKNDFWDPPSRADLLRLLLGRFRGRTGYLGGRAFLALLERALPVRRFEDCPKPCLLVALDAARGRRVVLDQGDLATAVAASGAVPVMFCALPRGKELLVDGGLVDKAPLVVARERLGAATMVVHYLPSASLTKPLAHTLGRSWTPLRLQARAVDAARHQSYQDQVSQVERQGVALCEVWARNQIRVGPKRLHLGPQAFAQAREHTREVLAAAGYPS